MSQTRAIEPPTQGVPELRLPQLSDLSAAISLGWRDFRRAPGYGLFFASVYVIGGLAIVWIMTATGKTWAALPLILGFPLLGPFLAVGLYEVSRRLHSGASLDRAAILSVIWVQKDRQLPSISAVVLIFFLFWNFLAHMIFALFMGLSVMTNITSSIEVFLTPNGLTMLAVGTLVGAVFSLLLFALTVLALPLLLDREVDFVTAMLTSLRVVSSAPGPMLAWGALVAALLFVGMLPGFLGLLVVLPLLGHATWHLYSRLAD